MSIGSWTLFVILAAVAFAAAFFIYVRREPPGRGRAVLALLRGAALSLILLLLFDPELSRPLGRAAEPAVLIDGSLSMRASAGTGPDTSRTVWDAAVEAARSAGTPRAFVFGDEVVVVSGDSLARLRPTTPDSRVVPALRAAVEAGATRALVLTDGRINDIAGAERLAREAGVVVEWRRLGPRLGNLALGELDAPVWAEAGEPITFRIGVLAADTTAGDSLGVSLLQDGRVLDRTRVAIAGAGRVAVATLEAPATAPDGGGLVRYDVALDPGDAVADDDRRSVYVYVADEPAGVVLVSFRPDWEPRFLLPALEEALGVPARGYLRLDDRWVATGRALDAGSNVDEGAVRRAAERADLLVLQAPSAELPAWARSLADSATRVIHLPAATSATEGLPIGLGPALPGEWYIAPAIPASPVAPQLAGLAVDSLPPLLGLRSAPQ
ncbi:MAG: vWA domain-containing protein, partial [Longimicrobiales bacterium]